MTMICSSSGTSYSHDLVHVENADFRADYGWYGHVAHDCHTSKLRLRRVMLPKLPFTLQQDL